MEATALESRVLILAPTKADARVSVRMLAEWQITAESFEFE